MVLMSVDGVYFLANDGILDLAIAFLNSFRMYNPDLPLCLIPFNADFGRIYALLQKYQFSVFSATGVLRRCDQISVRFHGRVLGHYRKLAIWEGPFERFVYVDSDTVALGSFEPVFGLLNAYDFLATHSNIAAHRKWVWKDSIYAANDLTREQISYSGNTGLVCSRKKALLLDDIESGLPKALQLKPHMELMCAEQAFLNYLIVTSGKRYSSLQSLALEDATQRIPMVYQAGRNLATSGGEVRCPGYPPPLLVHWAGHWSPTRYDLLLASVLAKLRLRTRRPAVRFFMPNKGLWKYYRRQSAGSTNTGPFGQR